MQFIANGPNIPNTLVDAHEEGRVVFFCGAGISYPAGLPLFEGLVDEIYTYLGAQKDDTEAKAYKNKQYDTTLNLLEARYPNGRLRVREALTKSLIPDLKREGATTTHAALLNLAHSRDGSVHLVTTNFDRIFNHLISEQNLQINEYMAPCLPIPKNSRWNGLVYLHGLLPKESEKNALNQLVVTSGDFGLAYLVERWAARFVSDLLQNFIVCFVGYGISDPVLRYLMDALAADRMLGEIAPQAYAFGSYKPGQKEVQKVEWEAKGVIPILYEAPHQNHSVLHDTLSSWAETYRDGIQGKERIVVQYAQARPSASTQQDDYVERMLWALSDASGLPAKRFAELEPVPPLEWLEVFSKQSFGQNDLSRFGISPLQKLDEKLKFSMLCRPASYQHTPRMSLTFNGMGSSDWDIIMFHLASWLLRHLNDPQLLLWVVQNGCQLQNQLVRMIERKFNEFAKLEKENNTVELNSIRDSSPNAIPCTPMRILWSLILTDRVKSHQDKYSFYQWKDRLERDGFNTILRLELRDLLTPKVQLLAPLQLSFYQDIPTENTHININQIVDWELVLKTNYLDLILPEIKDLVVWKTVLIEMFADLQQLLRDALDLQNELKVYDSLNDRSFWSLQSISPDVQNYNFDDWILLIILLRDSWLEIQKSNPARAKQITQNWFEQPYLTFKRLALFAAAQDKNIACEEWVGWLLENKCWWLWTDYKRETMRLLVLQGQNLTPINQKQLETAILAGSPQKVPVEDVGSEDSQWIQDHSVWLRLAKLKSGGCLLGSEAAQKLADLSLAYPDWQLATNESDEFLTWMSGTGDSDFEDQHPITRVPRQLEELVIWLKQERTTDPFNRNDWRDVCQQEFATVVRALYMLSQENFWPSDFWRAALQIWSDEKRVRHCWRFVAPLVVKMPDEVLLDLAHIATWWLEAASKRLNFHEVLFFDLCHRYLAIDHPNSVSDNKTIAQAINHPVGHITQALFNVLFYRRPNDNDCLPDDIKPLFTRLCGTEKESYRHGRVILAANLISLFRVDQEWTEHYLFPIMSWQRSESEAKAAWTGFMWSPRIYWPLLTAIKDDFLKTAKYYDDLGYAGQQYATILTYAALKPNSKFEHKDFRSAIESLPKKELQVIARALTNALESAGEQKEAYWQNCIKPFWQEVWPKSKDNISEPIAVQLARLSVAAGDEFPIALETVFDWLQHLENPYHILYLLEESKLCSKFPKDSLKLMDRIIDNPLWSQPELDKYLDNIITAWPAGQQDPRYQRLKNMK